MKKSKRRILALTLAMGMVMSALAGCGEKTGNTGDGNASNSVTSGNGETQELTTNTEVVLDDVSGLPLAEGQGYPKDGGEISIWHVWSSSILDSIDQVEAVGELEKVTGIKTNWTTVDRGEREEKFGILISSGNLPDLIYAQSSTYPGGVSQAVEDGVFMDVTDFAQKYVPNYIALINSNPEVKKNVTSDDGRLLCFYQLATTDKGLEAEKEFLGLCIRQDWLDELGLDKPVTIDDWHTVLKAFKEKENCEAPLMIGPKGTLINGAFTSAFGVMPEFYQEDGVVKFGPVEEGYRDFVDTFRQWYSEGLIDQNFMTNNVERMPAFEYTTTGMTGAFTHAYSVVDEGMKAQGYDVEDGYKLSAVANPVLKEGDTPTALPLSAGIVGDPMYVSANVSDEEALGAWLNYCYSKEGAMLQGFGIEGVDYTINDNGDVEFTDKIMNNDEYTPSDAFAVTVANLRFGLSNWYGGMLYNGEDVAKHYLEIEDVWTNQDMSKYISSKITMTEEEIENYTALYSDIQTFVDESVAQFIMGTKSMDEWDAFVEQLHSMGIDECISAKQSALDRYNAR